jgi:hypothetical protein
MEKFLTNNDSFNRPISFRGTKTGGIFSILIKAIFVAICVQYQRKISFSSDVVTRHETGKVDFEFGYQVLSDKDGSVSELDPRMYVVEFFAYSTQNGQRKLKLHKKVCQQKQPAHNTRIFTKILETNCGKLQFEG